MVSSVRYCQAYANMVTYDWGVIYRDLPFHVDSLSVGHLVPYNKLKDIDVMSSYNNKIVQLYKKLNESYVDSTTVYKQIEELQIKGREMQKHLDDYIEREESELLNREKTIYVNPSKLKAPQSPIVNGFVVIARREKSKLAYQQATKGRIKNTIEELILSHKLKLPENKLPVFVARKTKESLQKLLNAVSTHRNELVKLQLLEENSIEGAFGAVSKDDRVFVGTEFIRQSYLKSMYDAGRPMMQSIEYLMYFHQTFEGTESYLLAHQSFSNGIARQVPVVTGLPNFDESSLVSGPKKVDSAFFDRIAFVLAHEIVHRIGEGGDELDIDRRASKLLIACGFKSAIQSYCTLADEILALENPQRIIGTIPLNEFKRRIEMVKSYK